MMEEAIIESNSEQFSSPGPRPLSRGSISPSRKSITRIGSRPNSTKLIRNENQIMKVDDEFVEDEFSDTGYDTDLEIQDKKEEFDTTGKTSYLSACKQFGVTPVSYFIRHMQEDTLDIKHHGLGANGTKAISVPLVLNTKVLKLDLTDNWLGVEGGISISNMLKENCYITHLNLSDNHLGAEGIKGICETLQENVTIQSLNLSGNDLDNEAADALSKMILVTQKLEFLDLSHNNFAGVSGGLLGYAISENTSLKEIDLSWNHFRKSGAVNLTKGISTNIFLKKINLSWNGFALEGAKALKDVLMNNNVLEELNIRNNRINVEGAIEISKGLLNNENLRILDIGDNPLESAGGYGLLVSLRENSSSALECLHIDNLLVNQDFLDLEKEVKQLFPDLLINYTDVESEKFPKPKIDPREKVKSYVKENNLRMVDFFNEFDLNHNLKITREEFTSGLEKAGIKLEDEELVELIKLLDKDGDGSVSYSELLA